MHLFTNRSQRTSKCGKNISDTLGCASCTTFLFLPHLDVIFDLLLNRRTATWNLFVKWMHTNHEPILLIVPGSDYFLIKSIDFMNLFHVSHDMLR